MEKIGASSVQANISSQTTRNAQPAAGNFANITGSIGSKPEKTHDSKTTPNTPGKMVGSKPGSSQKEKNREYDADEKKDSNKQDNKKKSITDKNKAHQKASSDISVETNQKKSSSADTDKFDNLDEMNKPPSDMDPLPDEVIYDYI